MRALVVCLLLAAALRPQPAAAGVLARPRTPKLASRPSAIADPTQTRTYRVMQSVARRETGGAGGGTSWEALQRLDAAWERMRHMPTGEAAGPPPEFVRTSDEPAGASAASFDVLVCGGTIGIFYACALQLRGLKVCVLERAAQLRGREQDWNISMKELRELVAAGVLSDAELDQVVGIEFNPMRCAFDAQGETWTRDVLNVGARPDALITAVRRRFEAAGGVVREGTALDGLVVCADGVRARVRPLAAGGGGGGGSAAAAEGEWVRARLVLDAMGNASPILAQARHGVKPDGVCLVVGTCARGFEPSANTYGDIIATSTPMEVADGGARGGAEGAPAPMQLFWEAFPASSGPADRTTYLFTYLDAHPARPSLLALLERYWEELGEYQAGLLPQRARGAAAVEAELEVLRVVFGFFPAYRDSPTPPPFDRVLPVGDAGGLQSPLSFGGFGALTRHLQRLSDGVERALAADALGAAELRWMQPYLPNLAAPWLFQKARSAPVGASPRPDEVNALLGSNFRAMERLGERTLRPFLQDVPNVGALGATIGRMMLDAPLEMPALIAKMGPISIGVWSAHMAAMAAFTAADALLSPVLAAACERGMLDARSEHRLRCAIDAWRFGSGRDYEL